MDATVATGAAAMMAIRVLLDHEVKEEDIILVSLLMAESGENLEFDLKMLFYGDRDFIGNTRTIKYIEG